MINATEGYGKIKIKKILQQAFLIQLNVLFVKTELAILNMLGAKRFLLKIFSRMFLINTMHTTVGYFSAGKIYVAYPKKF